MFTPGLIFFREKLAQLKIISGAGAGGFVRPVKLQRSRLGFGVGAASLFVTSIGTKVGLGLGVGFDVCGTQAIESGTAMGIRTAIATPLFFTCGLGAGGVISVETALKWEDIDEAKWETVDEAKWETIDSDYS